MFWIYTENENKGPYTVLQLRAMWRAGKLTADTLYWNEESKSWLPLNDLCASPSKQIILKFVQKLRQIICL